MKVKCTNIYNEHTKEQQGESSWLTIDKEYVVLSIVVYENRVLYLIVDDSSNEAPGMHNATQFEVVNRKIPTHWSVVPGELELFNFGPKSWWQEGFWEACYENDPKAMEVYKREARLMHEEESEY